MCGLGLKRSKLMFIAQIKEYMEDNPELYTMVNCSDWNVIERKKLQKALTLAKCSTLFRCEGKLLLINSHKRYDPPNKGEITEIVEVRECLP